MNQNIVELLKKIRVQAQTIKGDYLEYNILETIFPDGWGEFPTENGEQSMIRLLMKTDNMIIVATRAPAGTMFFSNMCTDADVHYQVGNGSLCDVVSHTLLTVRKPYSFDCGILHQMEVLQDSIFITTYTNFK